MVDDKTVPKQFIQNEGSCFYHYLKGGVGAQDCQYISTNFILF
jgi:hypothetical protein